MQTPVDLAPAPEHRRGDGAPYTGLNQGRIAVARLRPVLTSVPQAADGRTAVPCWW
ncbi:hypothetical protein [Streptomyces sp. NPDC058653]|uniref:hypothetical protein n=1 Tax=Streptomyces sp. NPDC058653 TaxID=3346576 RepID=UPI00365DFF16